MIEIPLELIESPLAKCELPDSDDLKSGDLSLDLVRDDGLLVLADFKHLSNQLGSGSVVYH